MVQELEVAQDAMLEKAKAALHGAGVSVNESTEVEAVAAVLTPEAGCLSNPTQKLLRRMGDWIQDGIAVISKELFNRFKIRDSILTFGAEKDAART